MPIDLPPIDLPPIDLPPIDGLRALSTPRLVVFEDAVDHNLRSIRRMLEEIVPGSGFTHLMPHVKTHKSKWALDKLRAAGIARFKCSLNEFELLLDSGVEDIFVAYPLLSRDAERIAASVRSRGDRVQIAVQAGCVEHAATLERAAARAGVRLTCYLDLDVGNHRTGGEAGRLIQLAADLASGRYPHLELLGLHAYDGHNHEVRGETRRAVARECMGAAAAVWSAVRERCSRAKRIVVAGSPQFVEDLDELRRSATGAELFVSPGTFIYWDTNYERVLPGRFRIAAYVLAQVIDLPGDDLLTLNVGHKRWSFDQGPVERFSIPGLEFVAVSEEHTVLRRTASSPAVAIGDPVLIAPKHVCPTVNLWGSFTLVAASGRVVEDEFPVDARNR